jgi:hypothetical protein
VLVCKRLRGGTWTPAHERLQRAPPWQNLFFRSQPSDKWLHLGFYPYPPPRCAGRPHSPQHGVDGVPVRSSESGQRWECTSSAWAADEWSRARQHVAAGSGAVEDPPGRSHLIEDLRGDQGEVIAGAPVGMRAQRPGACGVAVPLDAAGRRTPVRTRAAAWVLRPRTRRPGLLRCRAVPARTAPDGSQGRGTQPRRQRSGRHGCGDGPSAAFELPYPTSKAGRQPEKPAHLGRLDSPARAQRIAAGRDQAHIAVRRITGQLPHSGRSTPPLDLWARRGAHVTIARRAAGRPPPGWEVPAAPLGPHARPPAGVRPSAVVPAARRRARPARRRSRRHDHAPRRC